MQQNKLTPRPGSALPAPVPELLIGLASSVSLGIAMGKLIRGALKSQVHAFDDRLTKATRETENPYLDRAMSALSTLGEPAVLYSLAGTSVAICFVEGEPAGGIALGSAILGSAAIDKIVKAVVHRPRPYLKLPLPSSRPSGSSFPSNHAMMSLATYGAMAALAGRRRRTAKDEADRSSSDELANSRPALSVEDAVRGAKSSCPVPNENPSSQPGRSRISRRRKVRLALALLLCAFIGWSRVYRGVHNPSDVIGGWITGGIWLAACSAWVGPVKHGRP